MTEIATTCHTCTYYWQSNSSLLIIKFCDVLWHLYYPWKGVTKLLWYRGKSQ